MGVSVDLGSHLGNLCQNWVDLDHSRSAQKTCWIPRNYHVESISSIPPRLYRMLISLY